MPLLYMGELMCIEFFFYCLIDIIFPVYKNVVKKGMRKYIFLD